jgi:hypothetical protein
MMKAPKNNKKENKPQLSLLPLNVLSEVAIAYEYGCRKYSRNSHRKGFFQSEVIDSALRHISQYMDEGQIYDKEAWEEKGMKVNHLAMAIFGLISALQTHMYYPEFMSMFVPFDSKSEVPLSEEEEEIRTTLMNEWAE